MDNANTSKERKEVPEDAWIDSYQSALKLIKSDSNIKVVHIKTGWVFMHGKFEFLDEKGSESYNKITVFVRRFSGNKISAGMEFRISGKVEHKDFTKVQGFHYRIFKRVNASPHRPEEVVISKYVNTTNRTHLSRFMKELKEEVRRFYILYMENSLLKEEEIIDYDISF